MVQETLYMAHETPKAKAQPPVHPLLHALANVVRPHVSITDLEMRRQSQLLSAIILAVVFTTSIAAIILFLRPFPGNINTLKMLLPAIGLSLVIYGLNRSGRYRPAAYLFLGLNFVLVHGATNLTSNIAWLFFAPMMIILSALFLSMRTTLTLFATSIALQFLVWGAAPTAGTLNNLSALIVFSVTSPLVMVFMGHRANLERERRAELETINQRLRASETALEERVAERTRDLIIAANVSRQVATILDVEQLLPEVVKQTQAGFHFYHIAIFLYDEETGYLTLKASVGRHGEVLQPSALRFHLRNIGLVTKAARNRQPVLVNDVSHSADYLVNPSLPDTRSQLAVPMTIGSKLIGVLDLQSEQLDRFSENEERVLQSLAEQVAVAVENARLYSEQQRIMQELRELDNMKSQFLASMSHELRTPLNAILNFTKFINMNVYGPTTDKQRDALEKIVNSGQHLLSLINDVLDITKIESGMMHLFIEDDVDPDEELRSLCATAETLLGSKPVRLIQDFDADLPLMVADRRRFRQILLNLISNACKFTEEGSITLSAKKRGADLLFAVIDTGPGIAEEALGIIFEPFQQTAQGIKHAGGTGLGLPIAKKLTEAHGGRLWVETQRSEGAAFYVVLPVRSAELLRLMDAKEEIA